MVSFSVGTPEAEVLETQGTQGTPGTPKASQAPRVEPTGP